MNNSTRHGLKYRLSFGVSRRFQRFPQSAFGPTRARAIRRSILAKLTLRLKRQRLPEPVV